MNATKAIFFLGLYLLALVHPAIPFIEYQVNKAYIVANLCENKDKPQVMCNGACHLKKQIQKQTDPEKQQPTTLIDAQKLVVAIPLLSSEFSLIKQDTQGQPLLACTLSSSYSQDIFRPPTA